MTIVAHSPLPRGPGVSLRPKLNLSDSDLQDIRTTVRRIAERLDAAVDDIDKIARFLQLASDRINGTMAGRTNNQFSGTLTANITSTTFSDVRIAFDSAVLAFPTTANAAAELGTIYQSTTANGSVTFVHKNTAATDKTFNFIIVG